MLISFRDEGSGPAVVLLHSGVTDGSAWEPQAEELKQHYRVIRPELRGFGGTPLPPERYSDAGDVVAVLDHLGVPSCHLVGSSLGGRVALEIAYQCPDRVASLALLCPAFHEPSPTPTAEGFGAEEERLIEAGDIDAAVQLNIETWLGPEASDEARDAVRSMQRHAFEVQLASDAEPEWAHVEAADITVPTLVVSGELDMDHFQNIARHLASSIPAAELTLLPWAAHLPGLERPEELTQLLLSFLESRQETATVDQ